MQGLGKPNRITEKFSPQFRAEFFNIFNTLQFGTPGTTLGTGEFGVISG